MKKADEIKVVKADIRRLKNRRRYLRRKYKATWSIIVSTAHYNDAIATLEKYLKKIERSK